MNEGRMKTNKKEKMKKDVERQKAGKKKVKMQKNKN